MVLPQRLPLCGGRTWINGFEDAAPVHTGPGLMDGLKAAHAELADLKASPLRFKDELIEASAPAKPSKFLRRGSRPLKCREFELECSQKAGPA